MSALLVSRSGTRASTHLLKHSAAAAAAASSPVSTSSSNLYAVRYASSSSSSTSTFSPSILLQLTSRYTLRISFTLPRLPLLFQTDLHPDPSLALAAEITTSPLSRLTAEKEEDDTEGLSDPLKWDGILNAAPKSRVSHSRKRMRAANKGLKDRVDLVHCQACGTPKLAHHICASCYSDITTRQKQEIREKAAAAAAATVATAGAGNAGQHQKGQGVSITTTRA